MVETSPDGRFRFVKGAAAGGGLGTAYDTENGLLVGWNVLQARGMSTEEWTSALRSIDLLKRLNHAHVLAVHSSWDASGSGHEERVRHMSWPVENPTQRHQGDREEGGRVVYLTTPCTTLEAFVKNKVEFLRWRVVKRWCQQIAEALSFLHSQPSPIVHKNLSLSSIYIDPSTSHIFVGGVRDIVPPSPSSSSPPPSPTAKPTANRPVSARSHRGSGSRHGSGNQESWGDRAWGLVAGSRRPSSGGGGGEGSDCSAADSAAGLASTGVARGNGGSTSSEGGSAEVDENRCGEAGAAEDIRAFGIVVIEMVLKTRLDPALARDEKVLEMLPAIAGWPTSAVDFLLLCRAPMEERPTAAQLLRHPFLEVGDEIDDEPVYSDANLINTAAVAAAAGEDAAETGARVRSRRVSPPSPLFAPLSARHAPSLSPSPASAAAGAAAYGVSPYRMPPTTANKTRLHDPSCPGCHGAGGWTSCAWSPGYATSCGSTESPSPSSPSAAPSFGGVPVTPSPPSSRGFMYDRGSSTASAAGAGMGLGVGAGVGGRVVEGAAFGGVGAAGGIWPGHAGRGYRRGSEPVVSTEPQFPPGVTVASFANASAIASRLQTRSASLGTRGAHGGRNRSVSYSGRDHITNAAAGYARAGGSGGGGGAGGGGVGQQLGWNGSSGSGGEGAASGRSRSASEDAVWDLLPSDESQCRRPFSVSVVESRRQGY